MTLGDPDWAAQVCARCDPVFESADVGFVRQVIREGEVTVALLWEADPARFAAAYPDSGVVEAYGSGWPELHCIDYWINLDPSSGQARISVEGWNLPDIFVNLTAHAAFDAARIAAVFARILAVPAPIE